MLKKKEPNTKRRKQDIFHLWHASLYLPIWFIWIRGAFRFSRFPSNPWQFIEQGETLVCVQILRRNWNFTIFEETLRGNVAEDTSLESCECVFRRRLFAFCRCLFIEWTYRLRRSTDMWWWWIVKVLQGEDSSEGADGFGWVLRVWVCVCVVFNDDWE